MPVIGSRTEDRHLAEHWRKIVVPYRGADTGRSVVQLATTVCFFAASWAAMLWSMDVSYLLTLLFALPASGFLIRLFMIQHDCGHGSYFQHRRARDWVGFCIGVITLIPYRYWRRTHAHHHAHSGNLDFKSFGDITTKTVREYQELPRRRKLAYRLYRHPIILLGIGPTYQFVFKHRYPWDMPRTWKKEWGSVWWTNLCLAGIVVLMAQTIGLQRFLLIQVPVTLMTCTIGVWLFYVQHQFDNTYWRRQPNWNFFDAVLQGSSHLVLPKPLQWITASIGLHHVHHLSSMIPNYKLQECLDSCQSLQAATRVRIKDTWKLLRLTLWNEETGRLVTFGDLQQNRSI
ncbi:MAG: fatty acid desaturase [Deltaproteobacteria bacterium]|nr:fatty acid desaturase [Deltaproteobacteria bacterium]